MPIGPAGSTDGGAACDEETNPPAVPSRPPPPPPPRLNTCIHGRPLNAAATSDQDGGDRSRPWWKSWNRKYVLLCGTCGASAVLLGTFYLIIYFVLRSYTSSLQYFETIPTYVPASVLILTGLLVLCFVRRKNRYSYLIKVSGCLCLVCAVLCVVVTVTTTVLHMNRLQTLHECEFFPHSQSCTCTPYTGVHDPTQDVRYEFSLLNVGASCDVIHGPLYSCLRALFGLSVIGILVSIFSCMLVYQLLSHEKKKMYWEQLEHRRRLLYRRAPAPNACSCCDDYGFVPPSELYPWAPWDTLDDRYWAGGHLYTPGAEDSSNASRSVLLGATTTPQGQGPLWLPWGGAWGAHSGAAPQQNQQHQQQQATTPGDPSGVATGVGSTENNPNEDTRAQVTGVLLRPFLPRGLENRLGLRRQHPPGPQSRRPLSDPGVVLQLPRYPPAFTEAYLPPMAYQEAFPRYMWGPPPPYSQPTSSENLAMQMSPHHHPNSPTSPQGLHGLMAQALRSSPAHRPATLADLMHGPASPTSNTLSSPSDDSEIMSSPSQNQRVTRGRHKGSPGDQGGTLGGSSSLPSRHRSRRLPIGHVKSLGDVNEHKHDEPLEVLFCDGKDITPLDKFQSQADVPRDAYRSKHIKSISDPKVVYTTGKNEQESELYFADVSSCISVRQDGDEMLYYSEPTSSASQNTPSPTDKEGLDATVNHTYEQVREKDDDSSHHASDDTMIVHTSSSDHSLAAETENTYSVVSPLTDMSSTSPMITDTDAYSCYTPTTSGPSPSSPSQRDNTPSTPQTTYNHNLSLHSIRQLHPLHPLHPLHHIRHIHPSGRSHLNDNESIPPQLSDCPEGELETEHCYETLPGCTDDPAASTGSPTSTSEPCQEGTTHSADASDLNGNVTLTEAVVHMGPSVMDGSVSGSQTSRASRANLSLPLRRVLSSSNTNTEETAEDSPTQDSEMVPVDQNRSSGGRRGATGGGERLSYHSSEPNTPAERRIHSVQDLLFTLKSVNV
ncbi:uncharacterized protein LOC123514327 isoform X1 [Portunus trituberculatus]|uniref:uncharacterized protein LOC123514327 isoform X1 n=1 Tax=Portunus trituberculatus TaxID=210409 RepID=UPI001E1CE063|nr:uncharacterized protein LOC123514327 isoform X1 [Portunus trituberculatus]XP_045128096.1 uncharacterized protein LOC123514327 isoform X1 [Portunus trituberculatus]